MRVTALSLIYFFSFNASAQIENLSELALFNRCYANLTGTRLPFNHNLRASVNSGTLTAANACLQVLDSARLQPSSAGAGSEGRLVSDTAQGRLVLQRLNDFHRSWFPTDNFGTAIPHGLSFNAATRFLYDQGESALHISRTLFTQGVNYSEVVLGRNSMEALRTSGPIQNPPPPPYTGPLANATIGMRTSLAQAASYTNTARVNIQSELVQFGDLIGLRPITLNPTKINLSVIGAQGAPEGYAQLRQPMMPHQSLGGGVLGTKSFLMLNLGRSDYYPMDGGLRVPRRWARAGYNSFMCRDLPLIRRADAEPFVQATGIPFRQSSNCMQCHASMDRTAYVARHISYNSVPMLTDDAHMHLTVWPTTDPAEAGPVSSDNRFHSRPTSGVLLYRSYDGRLINQNLSSIQDLGNAFSVNNEMYVCAASRYFKFFTGIEANLNDIGDTTKPALTADEVKYRDIVISLGLELKSTQSLRQLIQKILNSDTYRRSSLE
ncbi:MAG: hypothetical protein SGJ18_03855 [Pseudomonadota bacterium]|nr:hypothetical protein [Pseudomonadota bacterium]